MGVYIKGIEMPKSCRECPLATRFFDGEDVCAMLGTYVHDRDREDDCPLVPVPPHGDLIGREWLVDISLHLMNIAKNDDIANGVKWLWQYIIEAPTIIEAEGREA